MPKRVLVVEDTKNIREIVAFMLRNRGYEVEESGDGQDASVKAMSGTHDCIVLDAMLPHKSGFEICADLKANPNTRHIPVIMLTAITRGTNKTDEYWKEKSKADDFVSKPFKAAELAVRIEKLLGVEPKAGPNDPPPPPQA